jgi:hypothetical protein
MQRTFRRVFALSAGLMIPLLIVGCNANSDAIQILQSENTSLQATVTAQAGAVASATAISGQLVVAKTQIASMRVQMDKQTAQMNAQGPQPTTVQVPPAASSGGSSQGAGKTGVAAAPPDSTSFSFGKIVTARGKNNDDGCAVNATDTFLVTDPAVWVIAEVHNFKRGTVFSAKWSGGTNFTHENTWTVPNGGAQMCIHFYIEPKTLGLTEGSYSVTISAPNLDPQQVAFTLQAAQNAGTGSTGAATQSAAAGTGK